jgi:signal-transduction protein with cAMP-binding, CBS, and nucleotidyltransferase domain
MLAIDALTLMGRDDVNQLPVMSAGTFEGMVGRREILQLLQARAELNVPAIPKATGPLTAPREASAPGS